MDREKERQKLPLIGDPQLRQRATARIEATYTLECAISHLYLERKGRIPNPQEAEETLKALQTLVYQNDSQGKNELECAVGVLKTILSTE
jgi:hypothetical protein